MRTHGVSGVFVGAGRDHVTVEGLVLPVRVRQQCGALDVGANGERAAVKVTFVVKCGCRPSWAVGTIGACG